ncbi:hypothetical protein EJB05_25636, partial [Eragrostis curvula]
MALPVPSLRFVLLLVASSVLHQAMGTSAITRHYKFNVVMRNMTRLCSTKPILTVNGKFPGPTLYAREGDNVLVKVVNHATHNVTIHWHGIRQIRTGWFDGPAYITQCPIQPGNSFLYNFTITGQRGTLFWHAHINWLRATVHGAIVVLPKLGVPYPFPTPHKEVVVVLGEWWKADTEVVINQAMQLGVGPNVSDSHTINGHPGPLSDCASTQVQVDNKTGTATLHYANTVSAAAALTLIKPPPQNATRIVSKFVESLRSLNSKEYPANVPRTVDHSLLFTVGVGVNPCTKCVNATRLVGTINNVTFIMPSTPILQAHYYNIPGVFTDDFPATPLHKFNYTGSGPKNLQTMHGTRVYRLPYNASVQVVLQDTGIISPESHPIHLHGFNFFVIGRGTGNYNPKTSPSTFNLIDPIERNTIGVPTGGWTAIRFRADNPGVWFMHCHFEVHTSWGLKMVFVVDNGKRPSETLMPPPKDLPRC